MIYPLRLNVNHYTTPVVQADSWGPPPPKKRIPWTTLHPSPSIPVVKVPSSPNQHVKEQIWDQSEFKLLLYLAVGVHESKNKY